MFIEKLRDGTHEKIPERQYIFGVPQVDWKYHTRPSQYKPLPRPGRELKLKFPQMRFCQLVLKGKLT
ncbi:hypothetical protein RhiirA4_407173 [Rhizophagus irregularis]|uniref:Uncharacterized protein n=1 Tax=Rhizophagus irregularis TaxID=588596 RepID=A0A2I1GWZ0_9GLOM|nr:hypothetical protein RhiirA4_407173 [Rhizophagus irregularis]